MSDAAGVIIVDRPGNLREAVFLFAAGNKDLDETIEETCGWCDEGGDSGLT